MLGSEMLRAGSGPSEFPETGDPGAGLLRLLQRAPSLLKETATPVDLGGRQPDLPAPFASAFRARLRFLKRHARGGRAVKAPLCSPRSGGAQRDL